MRVAVTGAEGLLGAELCRRLGAEAIPLDRPLLDLTDLANVRRILEDARPEGVIHAAAYTNVDRAEAEPDLCRTVNVAGTARLAAECQRRGCLLVQISTDYVFGQDASRATPYHETDAPAPQGVYAQSKLDAEREAAHCRQHLIVRTCGLYGRVGKQSGRRHFVDAMLALGREQGEVRVVHDQRASPSYVPHVARAILYLLAAGERGTYHVVNAGGPTWHEFAVEIFRQAGMAVAVHAITTAQLGAAAPRPAYSVLDTSKYDGLGGPPLPDWRQALQEYLAELHSVGAPC